MRILVISDEIYPDAVGGIGKSLYTECWALTQAGHQVDVLVRAVNPQLPPESDIEGIHIHRFRGPARQRWYYYLFPLLIHYSVWNHLRSWKPMPDLIYLHSAFYMLPIVVSGIQRHAPVISTFYASADDYILTNVQRGKYGRLGKLAALAGRVFGWVERWGLRRADAVLPRSQYSLRDLRRICPQAVVLQADTALIPLCVDVDRYQPIPKIAVRQELGLPVDRPILITARRLEGRMGLMNLVEATAHIRTRIPNVLTLIAGKGFLRDALENRIHELGVEDNVRLLGFVPEELLPRYMAAADVFVLPTEELEGFGLVTIEAFAAGTPVIGTPIGATPELLSPVDPQLLTRNSSPEALAETITVWLQQPGALASLGMRCRSIAEQQYSTAGVERQITSVFEQVKATHLSG